MSLYLCIFHTKELGVESSFKKYCHTQPCWNANIWAFAGQWHSQSGKGCQPRPGSWVRAVLPATDPITASLEEMIGERTWPVLFWRTVLWRTPSAHSHTSYLLHLQSLPGGWSVGNAPLPGRTPQHASVPRRQPSWDSSPSESLCVFFIYSVHSI